MLTKEGKEWHVVYTRPRWEKKVFERFQKQGITAYCPLNKVVKQWSDRKKTVELPLFTSYVFVQILPEEQLNVRMTDGVVNFVYWLGKIAGIRDEEMEAMRSFIDSHEQIRVESLNYAKGDVVEIREGLLKGQQGIVQEVRNNKLELILNNLNVKLIVEVSAQK